MEVRFSLAPGPTFIRLGAGSRLGWDLVPRTKIPVTETKMEASDWLLSLLALYLVQTACTVVFLFLLPWRRLFRPEGEHSGRSSRKYSESTHFMFVYLFLAQ